MKWLNIFRNTCFVIFFSESAYEILWTVLDQLVLVSIQFSQYNPWAIFTFWMCLASNWDHLFAKTTRLFLQYHAWDVIYQHNNLVVLDWLHWSIIKLVQVTLSIPKMPLAWMKYKLFFQHFNEKLQIRLNANLFGSFESHLRNQHNVAFQWTKIIMIIISVYIVLNIYFRAA